MLKEPEFIQVPFGKIQPWGKNPRNIKTKELEKLAKSIQTKGQFQVLTCWENGSSYETGGGNMRWQAMKNILNYSDDKSIWISLNYPENEKEKIELSLLDNMRFGQYDEQALAELVYPHIEEIELEDYRIDVGEPISLKDVIEDYAPDLDGREDEVPEIDDSPAITKMGDLFTLGRHRLLCGDATKEEDVKRLMGGEKADVVFTDPPYGIDVVGSNQKIGGGGELKFAKIGGKNIVDSNYYLPVKGDESTDIFKKHFEILKKLEIEKFIVWGGNYFTDILKPSKCWIIWDKKQTARFSRVEMAWTNFDSLPVLYEWIWNGLQRQGVRTEELVSRVHPTQKPVGLFISILNDFGGNSILDSFLGSGTTLIACEKLNRICYGMEIEPLYIQVCLDRWANFTGNDPIREDGKKWSEMKAEISEGA